MQVDQPSPRRAALDARIAAADDAVKPAPPLLARLPYAMLRPDEIEALVQAQSDAAQRLAYNMGVRNNGD